MVFDKVVSRLIWWFTISGAISSFRDAISLNSVFKQNANLSGTGIPSGRKEGRERWNQLKWLAITEFEYVRSVSKSLVVSSIQMILVKFWTNSYKYGRMMRWCCVIG